MGDFCNTADGNCKMDLSKCTSCTKPPAANAPSRQYYDTHCVETSTTTTKATTKKARNDCRPGDFCNTADGNCKMDLSKCTSCTKPPAANAPSRQYYDTHCVKTSTTTTKATTKKARNDCRPGDFCNTADGNCKMD